MASWSCLLRIIASFVVFERLTRFRFCPLATKASITMSTRAQMYKCGGCEGQFQTDEALQHQNDESICREVKMLPIRWTQQKIHKNDLPVSPTSPQKPPSTKKASSVQKPISAKKVYGRNKVRYDALLDANSTSSGSGSRARTHSKPKRKRGASLACSSRDRNHCPLPPVHEPIFSATDVFVREPTPFAFAGRGSPTRDEYDPPIEYRESDFSVDYPISYEDVRDKSHYTLRGFSPNHVLYPNPLLETHINS